MLGNISISQLLIILLIVLIIFGGKRLKNLAVNLGDALKSFRKGMNHDAPKKSTPIKKTRSPNKKIRAPRKKG